MEPDRKIVFTAMYHQQYPAVLAYMKRRSKPANSEDLAAEVFARAWRNFDSLSNADAPLPWLYGISRNVVREHYRATKKAPTLVDYTEIDAASYTAAPEEFNAVDMSLDINRALYSLSTSDKEILMLGAWENLSITEIAQVLEITPNNARVRLHRARTNLSAALDALTSHVSELSPGEKN